MHAQSEGTKSTGSVTPTPGDGAANIDQATGTELSEFLTEKLESQFSMNYMKLDES